MTSPTAAFAWPKPIDWLPLTIFVAVAIGLPLIGYLFLYWDIRRWWRSLRRASVRVVRYLPDLPEWARRDTPRCVAALGLRMPCSEEQLKEAYRAKVKVLHPDHGGDKRRLLVAAIAIRRGAGIAGSGKTVESDAVRNAPASSRGAGSRRPTQARR